MDYKAKGVKKVMQTAALLRVGSNFVAIIACSHGFLLESVINT